MERWNVADDHFLSFIDVGRKKKLALLVCVHNHWQWIDPPHKIHMPHIHTYILPRVCIQNKVSNCFTSGGMTYWYPTEPSLTFSTNNQQQHTIPLPLLKTVNWVQFIINRSARNCPCQQSKSEGWACFRKNPWRPQRMYWSQLTHWAIVFEQMQPLTPPQSFITCKIFLCHWVRNDPA